MGQLGGFGGFDFRPSCPVCGSAIDDPELHQRFHDGLRELTRKVYCPDVSPEDFAAALKEEWDRDHPQKEPAP